MTDERKATTDLVRVANATSAGLSSTGMRPPQSDGVSRGDSCVDDRPAAGRRTRAERLKRERRVKRTRVLTVAAAFALVGLLAGAAMIAGGWGSGSERVLASSGTDSSTGYAAAPTRTIRRGAAVSTPVFARIGAMPIYLPVSPKAVTAVMFHQSARGYSYDMTSLVPDVDRAKVFEMVKRGAKLPIASAVEATSGVTTRDGERILDGVWKGSVVRVFRIGRSGKPASAADTGAKAGTVVVAPVSGTVTKVKAYKLYGRYPDFEVHIRPDEMTQADLVVIHVSDILVRPDDRLIGGVTPIAHVRLLSNRMKHQLADYTGQQGDHVHIQFNKPKAPAETPSS